MTEEEIREVYSENPFRHQYIINVSKDFIREFKDKIDWDYVSMQTTSDVFILRFGKDFWKELVGPYDREYRDWIDWGIRPLDLFGE